MPFGTSWNHSSPDDLMNMIIEVIIVVIIVIVILFFFEGFTTSYIKKFFKYTYIEGAGLVEFLFPLFFSTGIGIPLEFST
jgi:hypothetical protein